MFSAISNEILLARSRLGRATGGGTGTSVQYVLYGLSPPHLLCKIRSDKSKARENQDMTMKDNIRPSLLNYLPPFCHVSFATELSAPTPHHPASITLPLNPQSPAFSPARPGGFPLNTWGVAPSLLFKCLKFSSVRTPPKSPLLPALSQST